MPVKELPINKGLFSTCTPLFPPPDCYRSGVHHDSVPHHVCLPLYLGHFRSILESVYRIVCSCRGRRKNHLWRLQGSLLLAETQHSRGRARVLLVSWVTFNKRTYTKRAVTQYFFILNSWLYQKCKDSLRKKCMLTFNCYF